MRRILYPLLLIVGLMFVTAQPAAAAFGIDCKEAPVAEAPGGGTAGFFGGAPDTPPKGPGWADGAPVYEQYGLAGLTFKTYDLGCGPDIGKDPTAVVGTTVANWILEPVKAAVAATIAMTRLAYHPDFLDVFDPLLIDVTGVLRSGIFDKWVPLTLTLIGVGLLWGARRGRVPEAMTVVGWALLVMVLATAVFRWPVVAGSFADDTMGTTLGSINSGINGQGSTEDPVDAAAATMSSSVLFQQWKRGTFGGDSPTADKYAKAIYTSQALTWAEAKTVRSDPDGAGKALLDAKAKAWEAAAEKIKAEDPDAYQYLTGHRGETRVGAAILSALSALLTLAFPVVAAICMLAGFLLIRMAVVFSPLAAVVGVAHPFRGAVIGVLSAVGAALLNTLLFGVASAVDLRIAQTLLAPGASIPVWAGLLLLGLFTIILIFVLKPLTKLTRMTSPAGFVRNAAGSVGSIGSTVKDAGKFAAKMGAGAMIAHATIEDAVRDGQVMDPKEPKATPRAEAERPFTPPAAPTAAPVAAGPALAAPTPAAPAAALPAAATAATTTPPADFATHGPAWPAPPGTAAPETADTDIYTPGAPVEDTPRLTGPIDPVSTPEGDVYDLFTPDDASLGSSAATSNSDSGPLGSSPGRSNSTDLDR